jgi:hypothetical protein
MQRGEPSSFAMAMILEWNGKAMAINGNGKAMAIGLPDIPGGVSLSFFFKIYC